MTEVLTVRVSPELLVKADVRAAELGLDRGKYIRSLIEQDVAESARAAPTHRFRSEAFIGSTPLGRGPYVNRRVRALVRERLTTRRAKVR
jgi:hypothetical protein